MNKYLIKCFLGLSLLALPLCAAPVDDRCSDPSLHSYFPREFVMITLEKFQVPEGERDAIQKELAAKDKIILKTVQDKGAKMENNPLNSPMYRQETVKLFRETLLEEFSDVLGQHGIKDKNKTMQMLDDIQLQKAKRAIECRPANRGQPEDQQSEDEDESESGSYPM